METMQIAMAQTIGAGNGVIVRFLRFDMARS
jgi:hypothetical protein